MARNRSFICVSLSPPQFTAFLRSPLVSSGISFPPLTVPPDSAPRYPVVIARRSSEPRGRHAAALHISVIRGSVEKGCCRRALEMNGVFLHLSVAGCPAGWTEMNRALWPVDVNITVLCMRRVLMVHKKLTPKTQGLYCHLSHSPWCVWYVHSVCEKVCGVFGHGGCGSGRMVEDLRVLNVVSRGVCGPVSGAPYQWCTGKKKSSCCKSGWVYWSHCISLWVDYIRLTASDCVLSDGRVLPLSLIGSSVYSTLCFRSISDQWAVFVRCSVYVTLLISVTGYKSVYSHLLLLLLLLPQINVLQPVKDSPAAAHVVPSWPCHEHRHLPPVTAHGGPDPGGAALPLGLSDGSGGQPDPVSCSGAPGPAEPLWRQQHHHGAPAARPAGPAQPGPGWRSRRRQQCGWDTNQPAS